MLSPSKSSVKAISPGTPHDRKETVEVALNLGVAIPSSPGFVGTYQWLGVSALALFGIGREEGLAFAICMQAVWYVPTTIVGAVILVAHAKGAWRSGQIFDFGSPTSR